MSPSKLDPHQKARDFRRTKQRRKRHNEKPPLPVHVDVTSVTYASQLVDDGSRFTVLDALPEMDEEWVNEIVYVRSPSTGDAGSRLPGYPELDDSLAWIEISLLAPAPPSTGGIPGAPVYTWTRDIGVGTIAWRFSQAAKLSSDASGNLWTGSPATGTGVLLKFANSGTLLLSITLPHALAAKAGPIGVEVQPSNSSVWVGDQDNDRVHHYDAAGTVQTAWQPTGLDSPYDLAFNAGETILAVADEGATDRVRFYSFPALALLQTLTLPRPNGVDIDSAGNIYIGSLTNSVVYKYSSAYALLSTWGTSGVQGSDSGQFYSPYGVHVDAIDRVYVADTDNHRIQVFQTDGTFLTAFGSSGAANGTVSLSHGRDDVWHRGLRRGFL
jgi:sugar lactone lactonase YvrE